MTGGSTRAAIPIPIKNKASVNAKMQYIIQQHLLSEFDRHMPQIETRIISPMTPKTTPKAIVK